MPPYKYQVSNKSDAVQSVTGIAMWSEATTKVQIPFHGKISVPMYGGLLQGFRFG